MGLGRDDDHVPEQQRRLRQAPHGHLGASQLLLASLRRWINIHGRVFEIVHQVLRPDHAVGCQVHRLEITERPQGEHEVAIDRWDIARTVYRERAGRGTSNPPELSSALQLDTAQEVLAVGSVQQEHPAPLHGRARETLPDFHAP